MSGEMIERKSAVDVMDLLKEPIIHEFGGAEKEFEEYVKSCLPEIFENMKLPAMVHLEQQHLLKADGMQVKLDLLAFHEDGSLTVIEVKCPNRKHPATATSEQCKAIGQLLLYQNFVQARYGKMPRLFLVDNKIHLRTMLVFGQNDLPITLMEIQKDRVFVPYTNIKF